MKMNLRASQKRILISIIQAFAMLLCCVLLTLIFAHSGEAAAAIRTPDEINTNRANPPTPSIVIPGRISPEIRASDMNLYGYPKRTVVDEVSNIGVTGFISDGASLRVIEGVEALHKEGTCTACDELRNKYGQGEVATLYDVSIPYIVDTTEPVEALSPEFLGPGYVTAYDGSNQLEIIFPISAEHANKKAILYYCNGDNLESIKTTILNNSASFYVKDLTPCGIVIEEDSSPVKVLIPEEQEENDELEDMLPRLIIAAIGGGIVIAFWIKRKRRNGS